MSKVLFLNTYEIDEAVQRWAQDPVLGPATRTLANLRDAADQNSDGWAYWPKPCRAAAKLQQLIWEAMWTGLPVFTAEDVRKAYTPVKAFRTRSGLDFEIEPVS